MVWPDPAMVASLIFPHIQRVSNKKTVNETNCCMLNHALFFRPGFVWQTVITEGHFKKKMAFIQGLLNGQPGKPDLARLSLGLSFLLLLLLGLIISRLYQAFFTPLAKVPGPFLAKFTRGWQIWRYYQGNWHKDIEWLHEKYGPVVRIAPNEVSFVDHGALRTLYSYSRAAPKVSTPNRPRHSEMPINNANGYT